MKITLLCVGGLKEKFFKEAVAEYAKRLSAYSELAILEIDQAPLAAKPSKKEIDQALEKEALDLEKHLPKSAKLIPLVIEGQAMDSLAFASRLEEWALEAGGDLCFLIGGSYGLAKRMRQLGPGLSFSKMTFPHTLMRVILLEQIYRAFRILRGEPYHK